MLTPATQTVETLSQIIAFVVMIAPSASDDHVENHAQMVTRYHYSTELNGHEEAKEYCNFQADLLNAQNMQVMFEGQVSTMHAWCRPIFSEDALDP